MKDARHKAGRENRTQKEITPEGNTKNVLVNDYDSRKLKRGVTGGKRLIQGKATLRKDAMDEKQGYRGYWLQGEKQTRLIKSRERGEKMCGRGLSSTA